MRDLISSTLRLLGIEYIRRFYTPYIYKFLGEDGRFPRLAVS